MLFHFIPLEFDYVALDPVHLAEGKATNVIRGALGLELRRQACAADCTDSRTCPHRKPCLYQQLFEGETGGQRPSGYREPPRPFVLRSPDWLERTVNPGEHLVTSLHLFDRRPEIVRALLTAYTRLGEAGLGPGRGQLALSEIRQPGRVLWNSGPIPAPSVTTLDLSPVERTPTRVTAQFLTPTEIKVRGELAGGAAFAAVFARLHERLRFLLKHYCGCDPPADADGTRDAARKIVTVRQDLRSVGVTRYSTRTGQTHPLAGFVGEAVYEGDFTLLWQWLKASEWTGVGRQTVWGKGAVEWVKC